MSKLKGNLVVGQSGGPTVVINQSLIGIIKEALQYEEIGDIYGAKNGVVGILNEEFIDLRRETLKTLSLIAQTPSSALGSCRYKPKKEDCEEIFRIFEKYDVHYFFYIGGNDSAESANIINEIARAQNYELRIFHVPKTVDNDLVITDHCPGYGSAARYVALSFIGNTLDNHSLPGIKVDVCMGRHAGWLTAASAIGKKYEDDGPHLIYIPERPVTLQKILDDIENVYTKYDRELVAISEGVKDANTGEELAKVLAKDIEGDAFGNIQLSGTGALGDFLVSEIKNNLGEKLNKKLRVRADTLGYNQRCFPTIVSEIDAKESFMVGQAAVKYAMLGNIDGSVAINRIGEGKDYAVEIFLGKLKDVAAATKRLPADFINSSSNGVTEAFVKYAKPLIGKLPKIERFQENIVKKR